LRKIKPARLNWAYHRTSGKRFVANWHDAMPRRPWLHYLGDTLSCMISFTLGCTLSHSPEPKGHATMIRTPLHPSKLSTKIVAALLGFLLLALAAIGATLFLSWQLEGSGAAINDTGSLRMQSYRLSASLARVAGAPDAAGNPIGPTPAQQIAQINATFAQLRKGDPERPLFLPPAAPIQAQFQRSSQQWQQQIEPLARAIIARPDAALLRRFQMLIEDFVSANNTLVQLIEHDSERRTFWLRSSQLALVAMALLGTISMVYLMFMMIVRPVERLYDGMQRMSARDFAVRLDVEGRDEFGQLAQGFNQMADRLQSLYGSLEQRVQEKTVLLADKNRELTLLYDTAAFLQRSQAMESLCQGFLERISQYFQADGGSVRVVDERRDNVHMLVHHGLSPEIVESEHCIKMNDCLCGQAAVARVAVVHDMRQIDSAHELKCHREGFQTVSIFHIQTHQQYLGFFNLHFRLARKFDAREQALLETLGQLLGVAIDNLRLANREREMAISEERNLVAQGLHDSIAQSLNFLNLQVQMLEQSMLENRQEEANEVVPMLKAGIKECYDDVRELLHNFRTRLAENDLPAALERTVAKFRQQTGIRAHLSAEVDGAPFPPEQQLQILFIVQEALSNIRKHANATEVTLQLADGQDFTLKICDNGVGFDSAILQQKGEQHVGLHIMQERAQRLAATLAVQSAPGLGTTVTLQLPQHLRRAA
jgi:two-component system nitrate/nitrite sensor histidine kinase NarX